MKKKLLTLCVIGALSTGAQAQIGGKNVVLIHGFQPDTLGNTLTPQQVKTNGDAYWANFWDQRAEARIDWDSNNRVEGKIAQKAYNKVVELARNGTCSNGCVFVTHSTGDLVARYIVDNQKAWLAPLGLEPLNILTTLDFAGAGGGSGLADGAYDVANNDSFYMWPLKEAVEAFVGFEPQPENLGVLHDLRVSKARSLATTPRYLPRLRFVGEGDEYFGVTKPFLSGKNDSVVGLHSACGATTNEGIDSCVSFLKVDGERDNVNGPDDLWRSHYPVLMGDETHHSGTISDQDGVQLTYVYNGFTVNGVNVNFDTETERYSPWWYFGSADYYQYVKDSENQTMSENVYNTIN